LPVIAVFISADGCCETCDSSPSTLTEVPLKACSRMEKQPSSLGKSVCPPSKSSVMKIDDGTSPVKGALMNNVGAYILFHEQFESSQRETYAKWVHATTLTSQKSDKMCPVVLSFNYIRRFHRVLMFL